MHIPIYQLNNDILPNTILFATTRSSFRDQRRSLSLKSSYFTFYHKLNPPPLISLSSQQLADRTRFSPFSSPSHRTGQLNFINPVLTQILHPYDVCSKSFEPPILFFNQKIAKSPCQKNSTSLHNGFSPTIETRHHTLSFFISHLSEVWFLLFQ